MAAIAILDDYQNVALSMADWSSLQKNHKIVPFKERLSDVETAARTLAEFDVIGIMRERTPFQRALFEKLPNLRLLVTTGKRNASIDLEAAKAHGVTVCNTGGAGRATAELAIGLMIALARHFREEFQSMRPGGGWQTTLGFDLEGKTLGLLGLGNLGAKVGQIGAALGMKPIAWSENLTPEKAAERGAERVGKDELFRRADVITIHLILSDRTRGLVGARELGLMKPTALLINTSRGPIVDEAALLAALKEKRIRGFGADTYNVEPLPNDHPLRSEPRALLTPHLGYVTEETYRNFYGGMVQAIEAWLAGKPINVLA
ncbi:MAG TPA: D-2-hydroxyacid dehydrogenase family protein [Hyphomicrobiaceae bacterium]|jgi:phosphoglycerate dehydrogenase-like enzyme|nr:D-2-hydroxyacid dehydrogenase family protein [Hyphomicrobiaceae bacterium]